MVYEQVLEEEEEEEGRSRDDAESETTLYANCISHVQSHSPVDESWDISGMRMSILPFFRDSRVDRNEDEKDSSE